MIAVRAAPEPASFKEKVQRPGLAALAELVGEATGRTRPGPKRRAAYARREDIKWDRHRKLSYWTEALDDLRDAYNNRCAYLAMEIPHAVGWATVDHFVPKSHDWRLAYEWSNYRLCAGRVNGARGEQRLPLDPFALAPGLFALELTDYQVVHGPSVGAANQGAVDDTIHILKLNARDCCKLREAYVTEYRRGPQEGIAIEALERRAPFIAQELRRQGLLNPGDA